MKLIYKHSPACIVSLKSKIEIDKVLKQYGQHFDYEFVDVIVDKRRSGEISNTYGIRHESPQVIIIDKDENPVWSAAHFRVKSEIIIENLEALVKNESEY